MNEKRSFFLTKGRILMLEDRLLVWKFKGGNWDALSRIYDKYREDLLRLATSLLNDISSAEDIVQDVFVSFAQSHELFRLTGTLKGYLATCVANRARNRNRDDLRHRTVELDDTKEVFTDSKTPDEWIICSEELKKLSSAIAQLPYEQREAIVLHLQGDMKFKQIAKFRNVSIRTIQSRYRYGLDKLRSLLNSEVIK
ncbi:MAG: RNA polymerase sigma factor [Planctomycetota bacterium]|jgi:RNA polymerase sigma-70 factor (ECF subfamily)